MTWFYCDLVLNHSFSNFGDFFCVLGSFWYTASVLERILIFFVF